MFPELVTDLANKIGQCAEWDPSELRSPAQPGILEPIRLPAELPIAKASHMVVVLYPSKAGGESMGSLMI